MSGEYIDYSYIDVENDIKILHQSERISSFIGLTYDEFWYDNPDKYNYAIQGLIEKNIYDDKINWQLGQYIMIGNGIAFGSKQKYPQKPLFTQELYNKYNYSDKDNIENINPLKAKFINMMNEVNKTIRNNKKEV